MSLVVETLIVALVAYRLWRLLAIDDISLPIRKRLEEVAGRYWVRRRTRIADRALEMIECPWCLGSWIALGVAFGAWAVGWTTSAPLLVGLAAAVLVGLLSERVV